MKSFKEYIAEMKLSVTELGKRDNMDVFATKIEKGTPFIMVGGGEIVIGLKSKADNKKFAAAIRRDGADALIPLKNTRGTIMLPTPNGESVSIGQLEKTTEFGAKGAGSGTAKEDAQLAKLNKDIAAVMKETGMPYVSIRVKNKTHKVVKAVSTPGTPKSDFHLVDINDKEVVWISHKDGKNEKGFSQWGGVSEKEVKVAAHSEVQRFIADIKSKFGKTGVPPRTTVARKIRDKKLKNMAVFGVDYGGPEGRQNTSVMLQGTVGLKKAGKTYTLDASTHVGYGGETPTGGYEPVLMVIHKCDRNQFGIKCARFSIYPKNGRKVTEWI
jgi:hypothetical protein